MSFQGGFHGSTHAAMSLTGLVAQKRPIANGGAALPAATIMELLRGEGGVIPARRASVQRIRALTRELGRPAAGAIAEYRVV